MIVLMNHYVDDRDYKILHSWNSVSGRERFFNEDRLWVQRTDFLDAEKVIGLLDAAA